MVHDQTRFKLATGLMGNGTGQVQLHTQIQGRVLHDPSRHLVEMTRPFGGDGQRQQGTGSPPSAPVQGPHESKLAFIQK